MTPTTIKLPDALRRRVKRAARGANTSAHAFMVAAIARQTAVAEARQQMFDDAEKAEAAFDKTGRYFSLADVGQYVADKVAGRRARTPRVKVWPKSSSPSGR